MGRGKEAEEAAAASVLVGGVRERQQFHVSFAKEENFSCIAAAAASKFARPSRSSPPATVNKMGDSGECEMCQNW